jgi:hypothetical protein
MREYFIILYKLIYTVVSIDLKILWYFYSSLFWKLFILLLVHKIFATTQTYYNNLQSQVEQPLICRVW